MTRMRAAFLVFAASSGFGLSLVSGCTRSQVLAEAAVEARAHPSNAETESRRADPPAGSMPTSVLVAEIAAKVAGNLASATTLTIHSSQTVSFASEPLDGVPKEECERRLREPRLAIEALPHIRLGVEVDAEMTPTSMQATFRKVGSPQPEMILELSSVNGQPMFRESHWYAALRGYLRGEPYAIEDPSGVEGLQVDHALWSEIEAQGAPACALAEFYCTWIGDESIRVRSYRTIIGESVAVSRERLNGEEVYVLSRPCYDVRKDSWRSVRTDRFVVTDGFKLVAWSSHYTNLRFGARVAYMVVDRVYSYQRDHGLPQRGGPAAVQPNL